MQLELLQRQLDAPDGGVHLGQGVAVRAAQGRVLTQRIPYHNNNNNNNKKNLLQYNVMAAEVRVATSERLYVANLMYGSCSS